MIVLPQMRAAMAVASQFSLANYSGRVCHYEAGAITGLSDGDAIASWTDSSGNGRTLSNATSSQRPVWKPNIQNGRAVARFTAASVQRLTCADTGFPTGDLTLVFVVKQTTDMTNGNYVWLGGYGQSGTAGRIVVPYIGGVTVYGGNSLWGLTQYGDSGPDWSTWTANTKSCHNAWNVLLVTKTGTTWTFFKSTTSSNRTRTMTTATTLGGAFYLGGWPPASGNMINGDLAEFCLWNRVLTGAEIAAVMSGLGTKYAITINT